MSEFRWSSGGHMRRGDYSEIEKILAVSHPPRKEKHAEKVTGGYLDGSSVSLKSSRKAPDSTPGSVLLHSLCD